MAVTLDATPKGHSANSYVSLADAQAYFAARLWREVWSTAYDDDDRRRALIMATRDLDSEVDWDEAKTGWATDPLQALQFPRTYVLRRGLRITNDPTLGSTVSYYDANVVPQWLKDATCEQALAYLKGDRTGDPDSRGIRALRVGSISIDYDGSASQVQYRLTDAARRLVQWWATNMDTATPNGLHNVELMRA